MTNHYDAIIIGGGHSLTLPSPTGRGKTRSKNKVQFSQEIVVFLYLNSLSQRT